MLLGGLGLSGSAYIGEVGTGVLEIGASASINFAGGWDLHIGEVGGHGTLVRICLAV